MSLSTASAPVSGADRIDMVRAKALNIRRSAFTMVHEAQLGHPGGDFSAMDILATLYFGVLTYDPKRPDWAERDRFVMSKGHATGALYAIRRSLCEQIPDKTLVDDVLIPMKAVLGGFRR